MGRIISATTRPPNFSNGRAFTTGIGGTASNRRLALEPEAQFDEERLDGFEIVDVMNAIFPLK
jgi:hypothetical protein